MATKQISINPKHLLRSIRVINGTAFAAFRSIISKFTHSSNILIFDALIEQSYYKLNEIPALEMDGNIKFGKYPAAHKYTLQTHV